ncbi:MAG TPA: A/G-specific adenine glycosylase [Tepidisphaeraceae bacterium]|jgi:A/G-specific adenine glycosylase|nr:A/G-specific adenine glycosylase [Tepidisphaeraceae bacterium]
MKPRRKKKSQVNPRAMSQSLLSWYERHRRDLPWRPPLGRTSNVDPYAVLVSEVMLQQTQVTTVIPYFLRFMKAFATIGELAAAPEQQVLRLWQGLGYYSRARNLQAAAKKIVAEFGERIPFSAQGLMSLPGIGRYTAGAVASIAFGQRAPILDGNVARVLCRLDKIRSDPREPRTRQLLWQRAEQILPRSRVGQFNSALMELGATVCTPKRPHCPACPVRRFCQAAKAGLQDAIPPPRKSRPTPLLRRWTIGVSRANRWLIERRPNTGRWAGLWQFPTIEITDDDLTPAIVTRQIGLRVRDLRQIGQIRHALTHRRYIFNVFTARARADGPCQTNRICRWIRPDELDQYPLSRPQLKIAEIIFSHGSTELAEVR